MRYYILLMAFFTSSFLRAQVFPVETLQNSGATDKRINLVILSEGYRSSEMGQFISDANNFLNKMWQLSPFKEYQYYFNAYALKIPSNESGADHPATATDTDESALTPNFVDTYFNSTYDSYGAHRRLFYEIDGNYANNTELKINAVLASNFPEYDQAIIIVNSVDYGGSGGEFPMAYNGFWGADVTIHEIGHSMFDLYDEYYPGDILASEGINMTQESDPNSVRWKNWVGSDGIAVFQHEDFSGNPKDWYKPSHQECKMESINKPFCAVCKEGIIEKIHDLIMPIDTYTPDNTVDSPTFPLDLELNLIKPSPNTLESTWTLNGSNFGNNMDKVTVAETDLVEGSNSLTVVVHDNSPMLKVDNHDSGSHVYTVTWTINHSALGIDTMESIVKNYHISMYPNPSNGILNFKIESRNVFDIKVDILSLDGKRVKTLNISNYENHGVDISNLSSGVYVVDFYANATLISSKKLVKK